MIQNERMAALLENADFKAELEKAESIEALAAVFCKHGVQITTQELEATLAQDEGELTEYSLDEVAVGGSAWKAANVGGYVVKKIMSSRQFRESRMI